MPDTFVHFRGIKNDACRDEPNPNFYSHKFVVRHAAPENLKNAINQAMSEIFQMHGMICVKDETKQGGDFNNLFFVPMHMMARIEFELTSLTSEYPDQTEGVILQ